MKKLIIMLVIWAAVMVNAQETSQNLVNGFDNQLSVRFSNLTGYGVAYQYNFLEDYAVRTTAWFKYYEYILGPTANPIKKDTNKDYNLGVDLQRNIIKENQYRVFVFAGGGYSIKEKISLGNTDNTDMSLVTAGLGVGLEYFFMKNLSADLGLSYKMDWELNKNVRTYDMPTATYRFDDETRNETGVGINVGVNYNF